MEAVERFQQVIDNWPDCEYASRAQFLIGYCFEKLRKSGYLSEQEANPIIEQAYKIVVEKYPDSPSVGHAAMELGWFSFKKGRWAEAANYWQISLAKSPQQQRPVHILYPLGRAYEEIGKWMKFV